MAAVFHLEFAPKADVYRTANYLRSIGVTASVPIEDQDKIFVEAKSYSKTLEQLSEVVPQIPDVYRFIAHIGRSEIVLYEELQKPMSSDNFCSKLFD